MGANGLNAPTTNLDAPNMNSHSISDKLFDQAAKKHATPYRIHVLPLQPPWLEATHFLKRLYVQNVFCKVIERIM